MPVAKRALILGLDAMVPTMVEKFLKEGVLPNFATLLEKGSFTRILPVIPAQTPANWDTIATGATPGTHGVVQWGAHIPGEPVWEYHRQEAFNAGLCQAEYLWEALARQGKRSVVMNYAGYPPTTQAAVFIDWLFRPAQSYFDLAPPTVYHNCPERNTTDPIELARADGWMHLPDSNRLPLQANLAVVPTTEGAGPAYHLLAYAQGDAYDTVLVTEDKDAGKPVATLTVGQWSGWVKAPFRTADQGQKQGAFRFKLEELSGDGRRLRLYRGDAYPTDGSFCSDARLGQKLVNELGPYLHSAATCSLHCQGWSDWQTIDELMQDEARWWSKATKLAVDAADASLLVLHWHVLDSMGHHFQPLLDPAGSEYNADGLEQNWEVARNYYRSADRFVGAFMRQFEDDDTAFVVVSDHGMPANRKAVSLVNLFRKRGWVILTPDGKDVNWAESKLFFSQNHLWINLEGRDAGGVVPRDEYDRLRAQVIASMRDLKDPGTGNHVFPIVLSREDAPVVGLWGDSIGDVVYCYAGGYRWSGAEVLRMGEERLVFPCGGGNHGPMIPTYETEVSSVMGTLLLAGAGVSPGVKLPRIEQAKISTTDVAPTVAYLLGLEPPAQNEGRILQELLGDFHTGRPSRKLQATARPLSSRPTRRPRPVRLQGDVTDDQ